LAHGRWRAATSGAVGTWIRIDDRRRNHFPVDRGTV
jgi:hypothetical protein